MKLIQIVAPESFNIFLFGDDHTGTVFRCDKGFDKFKKMICSEYEGVSDNFGIHHGDILEGILVDDKRYSPEGDDCGKVTLPSISKQKKGVYQIYESIKDKIKVIHRGNHDDRLWRYEEILEEEICQTLDVIYGTWTSKITWIDKEGKQMFKSYHTHGRRSIGSTADDAIRRKSNMELQLKRHLKFKAGDTVLMCKGHTHKLLICEPLNELYLTDNGKEIKQNYMKSGQNENYIHPDHRWYVNTGSFLRLYEGENSGYAEKAEYDPIELGFAIAKIRNRKIIGIDKVVV